MPLATHDPGRLFWWERASETLRSWATMTSPAALRGDVMSAVATAARGLTLSLAVALACGLPLGVGLATGIAAGVVGALFSSAPSLVTGPGAALVPIVIVVAHTHGVAAVPVLALLAGLMQVVLGFARAGDVLRCVPAAVVRGVAAGIGLALLARLLRGMPGHDGASAGALPLVVAAIVVMTAVLLPRVHRAIPGTLVGVGVASMLAESGRLPLARLGEISRRLPPLAAPSVDGVDVLALLPSALAVALLGGVGTLLAAQTREASSAAHACSPDQELVAQGLANIAASFVGGIPVMGLVSSAHRSVGVGAPPSRLASVLHCMLFYGLLLAATPLVERVPVSALMAVLAVAAARIVDVSRLHTLLVLSPRQAVVAALTACVAALVGPLEGAVSGTVLVALGQRTGLRRARGASSDA